MVSAIPWRRHAIGPRANYNVQATGTHRNREQSGWIRWQLVSIIQLTNYIGSICY